MHICKSESNRGLCKICLSEKIAVPTSVIEFPFENRDRIKSSACASLICINALKGVYTDLTNSIGNETLLAAKGYYEALICSPSIHIRPKRNKMRRNFYGPCTF